MSATFVLQDGSPKRRRASRACLACRARKVRCDVVVSGKSCTNCRLDFSECVVQLRRKNRYQTVVVPADSQSLSVRETDESEDDGRHGAEQNDATTTRPPTQLLDEDRMLFSWNDPLEPSLPVETTPASVPIPDAVETSAFTDSLGGDDDLGDLGMLLTGVENDPAEGDTDRNYSLADKEVVSFDLLSNTDGFSLPAGSGVGDGNLDTWPHLQFPLPQSFFTTAAMSFSSPMADTSAGLAPPGAGHFPVARHSRKRKTPPRSSRGGMFVTFSRYPFLSTNALWQLDHEDDVVFLEKKGCLHVPQKPILDEFMEQYFLHVHPITPLINELDFWTMYNAPAPLSAPFGQISLFVFQAMLFFACPFVSQSTLADLKFSSVPEARASFYLRAKTLFHLEEGRDDISTAQGALMLTYHAPNMSDETNSYWLNTAIHFAKRAGAHRYHDIPNISFRRRTMLKRLWWCCILRDKIMALGYRRPMQIRPTDFDYSQPGLTENDTGDEIPGSAVYSPATKRGLGQFTTALCELAVVLNDILAVCYPASTATESDVKGPPPDVKGYVAKLDAWYASSTSKFKAARELVGNIDESLVLYTNAAYIYYYTAKACAYKYLSHFLPTRPGAADDEATWISPPAEVDESFRGVTKSLAELKERDLVRYLPNTFVSFAVMPFKWHVAGFRITDGKASGKEPDLKMYYSVFKGFGEIYEITDSALKSIGNPM